MRVANEPAGPDQGPFADLLRLQAQFQTRMAEETMRYLRAVQGALAPVAPSTVVTAADVEPLAARAAPGGRLELELEVENVQAVHVAVAAALTPLVAQGGTTWFPVAEVDPPLLLLPTGETATLRMAAAVPTELASGEYRGALLLPGFRHDGIPVVATVAEPASPGSGGGAAAKEAPKPS